MHPLLEIDTGTVEGPDLGDGSVYYPVNGRLVLLEIGVEVVDGPDESPLETIALAIALGEEVKRVWEMWPKPPVYAGFGQGSGHCGDVSTSPQSASPRGALPTVEIRLFESTNGIYRVLEPSLTSPRLQGQRRTVDESQRFFGIEQYFVRSHSYYRSITPMQCPPQSEHMPAANMMGEPEARHSTKTRPRHISQWVEIGSVDAACDYKGEDDTEEASDDEERDVLTKGQQRMHSLVLNPSSVPIDMGVSRLFLFGPTARQAPISCPAWV